MISFHTIHSAADRFWDAWVDTYLASFPIEEQRPVESIERLIAEEQRFKASVLCHEGRFIGLLTYWRFEDFIYIEHFAISPALRSSGYGTTALKAFIRQQTLPVVLEAEPPTEEMAIRRVRFYERNGFTLYHHDYYQPPYTPDRQGIPLRLMGTRAENPIFSALVARTLHREVYAFEPM